MERKPLLEEDRHSNTSRGSNRPGFSHKQSYDQLPCPTSYYGDNYQSIIANQRRSSSDGSQSCSTSEETIEIPSDIAHPKKHKPYFIYSVTIVNIALLIWTIVLGGIESIGASKEIHKGTFPKFGYTFNSSKFAENETRSFYSGINFFIGPNASYFVKFGAMYSPCIRPDTAMRKRDAKQAEEEESYTCCSLNGECGMMKSCIGRSIGRSTNCSGSRPQCPRGITVRPCCMGMHGKCVILPRRQCDFLRGYWNEDKLLCSEVKCINSVCGGDDTSGPGQGYRLMSAVFLHLGIIHLLLNLIFQVIIGRMIEIEIGTIRTACIYLVSGLGGSLVSGVFTPLTPQVGSSGALFGLIALMLAHYCYYYPSLRRPYWNLPILLSIIILCFALGTLPYVGNFVHIGGFVFGLLTTVVLTRRGTVGWARRTSCRYWSIKLISLALLITLTIVCFLLLYTVENTEFCKNCHLIDCIPWTSNFCPNITNDGVLG
ncbi:inactive rhomboid protein 1 [Nematostella vectensis]|uniref:inactive rhomboid protein 1 n=1 Tax=Nematostella vectensis TaxID=45351 RepID=UPI00138FC852|nr:inactive rhomboid protein 1 [Nematostella vectensis]